jgi:hypothetical protein
MTADVHTENPATPLSGLHLLLTYACNYECDHCFVWGSPSQSGTMTIETIEHILAEAEALGTIGLQGRNRHQCLLGDCGHRCCGMAAASRRLGR